jgi:hypothetical protein
MISKVKVTLKQTTASFSVRLFILPSDLDNLASFPWRLKNLLKNLHAQIESLWPAILLFPLRKDTKEEQGDQLFPMINVLIHIVPLHRIGGRLFARISSSFQP